MILTLIINWSQRLLETDPSWGPQPLLIEFCVAVEFLRRHFDVAVEFLKRHFGVAVEFLKWHFGVAVEFLSRKMAVEFLKHKKWL